jgi:hypothetical protein
MKRQFEPRAPEVTETPRHQRYEVQRSQFLETLNSPALELPLSVEQQHIIDLILKGENVFFTGVWVPLYSMLLCFIFLFLFLTLFERLCHSHSPYSVLAQASRLSCCMRSRRSWPSTRTRGAHPSPSLPRQVRALASLFLLLDHFSFRKVFVRFLTW